MLDRAVAPLKGGHLMKMPTDVSHSITEDVRVIKITMQQKRLVNMPVGHLVRKKVSFMRVNCINL